ncbi:hypothetical protein [Cognatiluteimonas weifangensis]|uniref:hypothetical protein n=1 Tax=Cognatiluteimonas weifangensis TaxID=2303539 RepID=UPI0011C17C5C|nr:hypothetical protein [Luteimonas weifangensis]
MKTIIAIAAFALASSAAASEPKITGTYSGFEYIAEAGDVVGVEITIVYSDSGYFALVQCAEGSPGAPSLVPATVDVSTVSFSLPPQADSDCPATQFQGTISKRGLTGTFKDTNWPGLLKRRHSYWQ